MDETAKSNGDTENSKEPDAGPSISDEITCNVVLIVVFLLIFILCGGVMRGCSNDIDGRTTYKWWAW